jgi:phage-related protein (TIGR01555 family)
MGSSYDRFKGAFLADSWMNLLTGLGTSTDKISGIIYGRKCKITDQELENRFNGDSDSYKIVTKIVKDAFRQGINITDPAVTDDEINDSRIVLIENEFQKHDLLNKIIEAIIWSRLFGGSGLIVRVDDGKEEFEPLDMNTINYLKYVKIEDRRRLVPYSYYENPEESNYGEIESYQYNPIMSGIGGSPFVIHESRMLIFHGALTTEDGKRENNGWSYSVLERVDDVLKRSQSNWSSVANMMTDASQGVVKITNFWEIIAGGLKDQIKNRLIAMDIARSSGRVIPIDKEEEFSYQERSFSGIPEILEKSMMSLSSVSGIPVTVYYGRSPAGENSTGELDIRNWYDEISSEQKIYTKNIDKIIRIVAASIGFADFEQWSFEWPSLWQMSPTEESDHKNGIAQTDKTYVDMKVLTSDEIRQERFGPAGYSDSSPVVSGQIEQEDGQSAQKQVPDGVPDGVADGVADSKDSIKIMLDIMRLFAKINAPNELMQAIASDIAVKLNLHDEEVLSAIETNNFKWIPELFRVDGATFGFIEPVVVGDVKVLKDLVRVSAPQSFVRRIVSRIVYAIGLNSDEMDTLIQNHNFSLEDKSEEVGINEELAVLGQMMISLASRLEERE